MIKVDNAYYYSCDDDKAKQMKQERMQEKKNLSGSMQVVGDVKQYVAAIYQKVKTIKQLRDKQKKEQLQKRMILDQLNTICRVQEAECDEMVRLQILVPQSIYKLEERLQKIQSKFTNNQIFRQKAQRKGKLSERIKFLSSKIETLTNKSPDIIISNIQNYYQNVDEKKQEHMKTLFLYEASSNTKGLTDEIQILTVYLQNLNELQLKLKGMSSKKAIVQDHQRILTKRKNISKKIAQLSEHMRKQYEQVMKEIDSI